MRLPRRERAGTPLVVVGAVLVFGACMGAPPAVRAAQDRGPAGTMETLSGPGYCLGPTVRDPTSPEVRSLAIDSSGRIFFDTGPAGSRQGLVAAVSSIGRISRLATGVPASGDRADSRPAAGRIAANGSGGVVVAAGSRLVENDPVRGLTTVSGDPSGTPVGDGSIASGDGGPAARATFVDARSLTTDEAGNLYIVDVIDQKTARFRIRLINRGIEPITVYASTAQNTVVLPGHIDTIAGLSDGEDAGRGGIARQLTLQGLPPSLAVHGGRLYVATHTPQEGDRPAAELIRVINLTAGPMMANGVQVDPGRMETVAGGREGFRGDGGPARSGAFSFVPGMAAGPDGALFLADEEHHRVRRIDAHGVLTSVAGTGGARLDDGGFNGDDRPAVTARLNRPFDVKLGDAGRIYVSDRLNDELRYIDSLGFIRAAPGSGFGLSWTCGVESAPGSHGSHQPMPLPGGPASVTADDRGHVYLVDTDLHQVKEIEPSGVVTTVAGADHVDASCLGSLGCAGFRGDGGPAARARLYTPTAVAVGPGDGLYVLDAGNARVRYINRGGRQVTVNAVTVAPGAIATIAGDGTGGARGDGGRATRAQLSGLGFLGSAMSLSGLTSTARGGDLAPAYGLGIGGPSLGALAADRAGNLFIADPGNHRVRQVDASGTITTFAGEGAPVGRRDCCSNPSGLALDRDGNLFVSDIATYRVWAINRGPRQRVVLGQVVASGAAQPVAGNGTAGLASEGTRAVDGPITFPQGLAIDREGALYMAEIRTLQLAEFGGDILRIDRAGRVGVLAGSGAATFNGDRLKGRLTALNVPTALAFDGCGNLIIADVGNDRVRRLDLAAPCVRVQAAAEPSDPVGGMRWPLVTGSALAAGLTLVVVTRWRRGRRQA